MIELDENPYVGLNPHLMSLFQSMNDDLGDMFHSFRQSHVTHIHDFLNQHLPKNYIAVSRETLQGYERYTSVGERFVAGVDIHGITRRGNPVHGKPLVRIELLSPANMPGESYDAAYQQNRTKTLLAGTPLIEIDYLHEYPSPIIGVPNYPHDKGSKPYYIALSTPKLKGVDVYLFGLDEPIPIVPIPLAGDEVLNFDFGEPFVYTWETSRFGTFIDYEHEPARMEAYSLADQAKIRRKMAEVAERTQQS